MTTTAIQKNQQDILTLLNSSEDDIVLNGLEELKKSGTDLIIPDVLEIFINSDDEVLTDGLKNILFEIKSKTAVDHIFKVIAKDKSKGKRDILVSIIWQAGLDASNYILDLVDIAIENDYLTCLECLTVIENFDTEFTEEDVLKSMSILKDAVSKRDDKMELLHGMHEVIQNFIVG
jgi:hypothetical protein